MVVCKPGDSLNANVQDKSDSNTLSIQRHPRIQRFSKSQNDPVFIDTTWAMHRHAGSKPQASGAMLNQVHVVDLQLKPSCTRYWSSYIESHDA